MVVDEAPTPRLSLANEVAGPSLLLVHWDFISPTTTRWSHFIEDSVPRSLRNSKHAVTQEQWWDTPKKARRPPKSWWK